MTTENTEVAVAEEDLESGFNAVMGDEPAPVPAVEPEPTPEPAPVEPEPTPEPAPAAEPAVTLSADEAKKLLQRLDELDAVKKQLRDTNGRIGVTADNLRKLQETRAAGGPVEITDDDLAALGDFGELKDALKTVLPKVLSKSGGASSVDLSPVEQKFQEQITQVREETRREMHAELLTSMRSTWRDDVKKPEFGVWLNTQPEDFRERIGNSWNAFEVANALKQFDAAEAEKTKAQTAQTNRTRRLEAAVIPTGNASAAPVVDEEDAMQAAFKAVRG